MKKAVSTVACVIVLLACCRTTALSLDDSETYSLERIDDSVWRINADSDYYRYFNKIHQAYGVLLKEANDPAEARRLCIERDLLIAEKRLTRLADRKLVQKLVGATEYNYGANPTGHLFRLMDVEHVPPGHFTPSHPEHYAYQEAAPIFSFATSDAMTAIIQFDRQLKKRGVSLIVVPVPNSVQVYTHLLSKDIRLEDVIWHPWAHMIAKLLTYDVEVIDLLDLYKAYSGDNTVLNYIDHHWGQAGLDIASREIAQRLGRYRFDKKFYCDPGLFKRIPITVPTPALIPYWDKISVASIAARMSFPSKYNTVRITYNDRTIEPAASFEDSPVLLMGDSFIPHLAEHSAGIYANLAYYSRIIPAAFSHDAGAADPPEWYARYVAGKGKEPAVVIWEIYGSAFEEISNLNDWKVVQMPEPAKTAAGSIRHADAERPVTAHSGVTLAAERKLEWLGGEVIKVSSIPDLKKIDYPDALYAFQVRVDEPSSSRVKKGSVLLVYSWFMEKRTVKKEKLLREGERLFFYLEPWMEAAKTTEKIGTMQVIDDCADYESDVYYCHFHGPRPPALLQKLKKNRLEGRGAAGGAVDKDGNPLDSIAFALDRIRVIESLKVRLRNGQGTTAPFLIETSLDGKKWFSLYRCQRDGGGDVKNIVLDSPHPALYLRLTGRTVQNDIALERSPSTPDDFSGIEVYGY